MQRTVLVTGASSGIGLALARELWESPYRVVVTARASSLTRFANEEFHESDHFLIRKLDVTLEHERRELFEEIAARWGGIDVLINNAGISYRSVVEHLSAAEEQKQLAVNYHAPLELIKLALPWMRSRGWGRILNISSVSGMMAMPTMGAYSASKFALEGVSESLWYELRPWGVGVSLVQPGFVRSDSFLHVLSPAGRPHENDPYEPYYRNMERFIERLMELSFTTPRSVARRVVRLIEHPDPPLRVPATLDASFFSVLRRLLPRRLYHWILYRNLPGIAEWGRLQGEPAPLPVQMPPRAGSGKGPSTDAE